MHAGADDLITAQLIDGPLAGGSEQVAPIEGRPPKTIDVTAPGDARLRYCLAEWTQQGHTATYSFLYEV
jgi:hypothetical protein